jgi:hypothetical protein
VRPEVKNDCAGKDEQNFIQQTKCNHEESCLLGCYTMWLILRTNIPPKCPLLQEAHSITSQKTTFFIVTAMKASDITKAINCDHVTIEQRHENETLGN